MNSESSPAGDPIGPHGIANWLITLAALAPIIGLALSYTYHVCYFGVFGLHYLGLMSINDYITSAIPWMPFVLLITIAIHLLSHWTSIKVLTWVYDRDSSSPTDPAIGHKESRIRAQPRRARATIFILRTATSMYFLFLLITSVYDFFTSTRLTVSYVPHILSLLFMLYSLNASRLNTSISTFAYSFCAGFAIFLVSAIALTNAQLQLSAKRGNTILLTSSPDLVRRVVILRSWDRGILVREPKKSIIKLIPWDQIRQVASLSPEQPTRSRACRWIGWRCPPTDDTDIPET